MSALAVQIVLIVTTVLYVLCGSTPTAKLCERILYGVYAFVSTLLVVLVHIIAQ